jgi:hypothetical protein
MGSLGTGIHCRTQQPHGRSSHCLARLSAAYAVALSIPLLFPISIESFTAGDGEFAVICFPKCCHYTALTGAQEQQLYHVCNRAEGCN